MSEQDGTQSSTKQCRSRKTNTANPQKGNQAPTTQRPANDDTEAWKAYWKEQGQPWRTEPEIDAERQKYLTERRSITPDWKQGIYPFKDIKLSRADVEWLLATHENGRGPVDWSDENQRERKGLDLRGTELGEIDLSELPLAGMIGGISKKFLASERGRETVTIHLEGANLHEAHLEGANLIGAHLEEADINGAHLDGTDLRWAHLEGANLNRVRLEGADLRRAHLERALLMEAHLEGANLKEAYLGGANLGEAFFSSTTKLNGVILSNKHFDIASLVDVHWNDVNITVVDWSATSILGNELMARQFKNVFDDCEKAMRSYHQLATVLRNQGLNEEAARFAYRAQLMQREVFLSHFKLGQYFLSLFLDLLAGYGYKPWRSFVAYLLVITAFATAYFVIGRTVGPSLSPVGSFVFSMTSFHGRGFFPGGIGLDDPLTVLAALEAFIGLLIEVTFIATLTQRLFGK
jgi:uncharacterized protein YjbI with pentapeptide repeats